MVLADLCTSVDCHLPNGSSLWRGLIGGAGFTLVRTANATYIASRRLPFSRGCGWKFLIERGMPCTSVMFLISLKSF